MKKFLNSLREKGLRIRSVVFVLSLIGAIMIVGKCRQDERLKNLKTTGETMGTFYEIYYIDDEKRDLSEEIDSILSAFNQSLSTYIPTSEINQFNRDTLLKFQSPYFYPVLEKADVIHQKTNGYFDPTVGPLVKEWGFGFEAKQKADSSTIDSIKSFVGYHLIKFNNEKVWKLDARIQLDFSAIAKGYGVDIIAGYLMAKGIDNYFINIGGEVRASGTKPDEKDWVVGVEDPTKASDSTFAQAVKLFRLLNRSIATSGDYRNYKKVGDKKYGHTINPLTGYPAVSDMISVSVVAEDCMTADAYATAFMSMGAVKAIQLSSQLKDIAVYFIYLRNGQVKTYISKELKNTEISASE